MIFVFDLDDTICDTDGYSEKYILNFFKRTGLPYKQIAKTARFAEMKFDWDFDIALAWYKTFGDEMALHFPIKNNAVEIINSLYNQGHKIIIATARSTDWHTEPEKITFTWLKTSRIKYNKIYFGRTDKEKICEEENADFFVDDDLKTVERVNEYFKFAGNGKAYLMSTDYNKTLEIPEDIQRIDNLQMLLNEANKERKQKNF